MGNPLNETANTINQEAARLERLNRAIGSVVGLAVGDALGSTVEFTSPSEIIARYGSQGQTEMRGGGPFGWEVGQYTDDGEMMMCLLESLVASNQGPSRLVAGLDINDLGRRFLAWYHSGPQDIGLTVSQSLERLERGIPPGLSGDDQPASQANGAIMRCSPVAVLWHRPAHRNNLQRDSLQSAYPTHRSEIASEGCVIVNTMIAEFINGADFTAAFTAALRAAGGQWHAILTRFELEGFPHRGNSGWAVSTLLTALHCIRTTGTFEEAVIKAVNGGNDADTVGAVTGELAGAYYGAGAIPPRWSGVLKDRDKMTALATTLFDLGER